MFFSLFKRIYSGTFIFFVLFCIGSAAYAQYDPQFSQNMFNPLIVNSGFAGSSGRFNLTAMDRHQWVGFEGAPRTTVVGADLATTIFGNPSGVGLVIMNDEIGFFSNLTIQGVIGRQYILDDMKLGIGMNVGLVNQVFDGTKAHLKPGGSEYHSDTDPLISKTKESATGLDAGFGVSFIHPDFYVGLSVLHLFEPKPNFNEQLDVYIPRSFFFMTGYNHHLLESPIEIRPSLFVKNSGPAWQFDLNVNLHYMDKYWGGLSYRLQDAVVLMAGMELNSGIRVGYSYDITTSKLNQAGSNGSHEIMVGYTFDLSFEKRDKQYRSVRFL
ncbi:MAG: type IX secretion system membrane protein PorP/SprF [Bacteroidales bacterium]|nr:type IX secretion system membrane protein PorP/SprF [Bacteroidales bacterium]